MGIRAPKVICSFNKIDHMGSSVNRQRMLGKAGPGNLLWRLRQMLSIMDCHRRRVGYIARRLAIFVHERLSAQYDNRIAIS